MVGAIIGIRQAVSNTEFEEGPRLTNGVAYMQPDSDFFKQIKGEFFPDQDKFAPLPMIVGGHYYAIVGDTTRANSLDIVIKLYAEAYKKVFDIELTRKDEIQTQDDLFKFIRSNDYTRDSKDDALLFAVGVPDNADQFNYTIYMSDQFPQHVPQTEADLTTSIPQADNFDFYSKFGFMTLQALIAESELIAQGKPTAQVETFFAMGYIDAFTQDDFLEGLGASLALFMLIIFIAPLFRLVSFLTQEKASRAREGMKIMGLNDSPYWLSWFIYYFSV